MTFWVIIAFLTFGIQDSMWVHYDEMFPTKSFCQTLLETTKSTLDKGLEDLLTKKGLTNFKIDEFTCINSHELEALDKKQYLNLLKVSPRGIST